MTALTLPNTLTPGTFEDVGDVQENFDALRSLVNGGLDGANLSQAAGEALAVSGANIPRRGAQNAILNSSQYVTLTAAYQRLVRAPTVVMPSAGLLHVSAMGILAAGSTATWSICLQLNGVIARSRFGVAPASGVSVGLMERTGMTLGPAISSTLWFTDTGDTGWGSLFAPPPDTPAGTSPFTATRMLTAFVPIVAGPGSYVVDVLARHDTGATVITNFDASIYVRTEAF